MDPEPLMETNDDNVTKFIAKIRYLSDEYVANALNI